jgi:hypothetical protein
MNQSHKNGFWANLEKRDRRILIPFVAWLILIMLTISLATYPSPGESFGEYLITLLGGLIATFTLTGIIVFIHYYRGTIIPHRKILFWSSVVALLLTIIAIPFDPFTSTLNVEVPLQYGGIISEILVLFLLILTLESMIMFLGFGMVWILALVERSFVPNTLDEITGITQNTAESKGKVKKLGRIRALALQWLFNIPNVLDTRSMNLNSGRTRAGFPWKTYKIALFWVMIFGFVVTVLITLNPFLLRENSLGNLFGISGTISMGIPLLVLPWFIFLRLNVYIKGPAKDFTVYNGLKSRTTQTLVTFGTLILIIRLAFETIDFQQWIYSFINSYTFFLGSTIITVFVYFNYFENDLASYIANRYREIKQ